MSTLTLRSNSPPCKAQFEPIVRLSEVLALTPASIDIESGAASIHTLALPEFFGNLRPGEAVHMKPLAVINGVPSGAESSNLTELVNLLVAATLAKARQQRDLMRPAAINAGRRQLALPAHARTAA